MRRLIFGMTIGSLAAVVAAAVAIYYFERPSVLRIAVRRPGESSRVLEEGHADLAIVRSDIAMPPSICSAKAFFNSSNNPFLPNTSLPSADAAAIAMAGSRPGRG